MNLLEETKEILSSNGKTIFDIEWYGTHELIIDADIQSLFNIEYSNGFGGQIIPGDLIIVGNGFWLERGEYDGSEWWEYKSIPKRPLKRIEGIGLIGDFYE